MEEKIIIKSKKCNFKKICIIWIAITVIVCLILNFVLYNQYIEAHEDGYCWPAYYNWKCEKTAFECATDEFQWDLWWSLYLPLGVSLFCLGIFSLLTYSSKIVVTDKRVYGKTYFGRSVDLPMDSISAVGSAWFKGIAVSTPSGHISFLLIQNAKEIHATIRKLLIERQDPKEKAQAAPTPTPTATNPAEELKKYKELLDSGVITQEDFDAKKKQLLGL